jgi:hypothetical protein
MNTLTTGFVDRKSSLRTVVYSIPPPVDIPEGSNFVLQLKDINGVVGADTRLYVSRGYISTGGCSSPLSCSGTTVCSTTSSVCAFDMSSGNFYAAVESRGNPDAYYFNITASILG